jgi:hypothetical protein
MDRKPCVDRSPEERWQIGREAGDEWGGQMRRSQFVSRVEKSDTK